MATLLVGVLLLAAWVVLTFIAPAGLGVVHLLLGAGVLLVIRGWVVREPEVP